MATLLAYTKKENRALNLFVQSMSNNQLLTVRKEKIAKGIWNALANHHVDKGLANKIFLTRNFMFLISPTNIMEVHFNKLEAIEMPIQDEVKIMVLLISLFDNYQNVITTMETL
jgi:hypothetical protein